IMRTNDQEGTVMLSKRRFDAIAGWDKIVEAEKNGEILEGTVVEIVNGGVVVATSAARVFIPASHATISRDEPIEQLKGQKVSFKLLKVEQRGRRRRAVGSIRLVLRDELRAERAKLWETIAEGERYTGTVKSITGYGAFVDLGGVDGMVHISELSWARIKHPSEVVCVGDKIEVYVKALDKDAKKISLGYKKPEDNPWVKFIENNKVDDVINVTIVSVTPYGAFARILPGVDGLIHISQIANKHVEKPQDELSVGEKVDVKIIGIDEDKKRISLSIRALAPEAPAEEAVEAPAEEAAEAPAEEAAE
ncbi:MAG: S1 RNA-binding domain-containing protein, partial [Clostridia bacterium]|nr:S1 RNA-binding domain-containing protein [Clostridia bacterium]